jgi:hypothetical protein
MDSAAVMERKQYAVGMNSYYSKSSGDKLNSECSGNKMNSEWSYGRASPPGSLLSG